MPSPAGDGEEIYSTFVWYGFAYTHGVTTK
jgi:hypothetical protein